MPKTPLLNRENPDSWQFLRFLFLIHILLASSLFYLRFQLHSLEWAVIYGVGIFLIFADREAVLGLVLKNWPLFLFPLIALLSTYWSDAPSRSMVSAVQLLFTVVLALWMSVRFSLEEVFKALLIISVLGAGLSLVNIWVNFLPVIEAQHLPPGESPFLGIYSQKNVFGRAMVLGAFAGMFLLIFYRHYLLAGVCGLGFGVLVTLSQSATSLVLLLVILAAAVVWWWFADSVKRWTLLYLLLGVILLAVFAVSLAGFSPVEWFLNALGKDSTLTGRTYLWSVAMDYFERHPWLGVGYQAFWQPGLFPDVGRIHSLFSGQQLNGFHNAPIEVLVGLGVVGLLSYLLMIGFAWARAISELVNPRSPLFFASAVFLLLLPIVSLVEVLMTRQHEVFLILFFYMVSWLGRSEDRSIEEGSVR